MTMTMTMTMDFKVIDMTPIVIIKTMKELDRHSQTILNCQPDIGLETVQFTYVLMCLVFAVVLFVMLIGLLTR